MRLNTLAPAHGHKSSRKRVGRGVGSGVGKTAGRGHKGLTSRSGGKVKAGFEGGQMPLQKRLPKYGFKSRVGALTAEIRLSELNKIEGEIVDIDTVRKSGLINANIKRVKIFLSGELTKAVLIKGLAVTKGVKSAVEAAGGRIEE